MENAIVSLFSGLGSVVNKLLGSPFDFLAGKSCSSICGSTWDLFCYIENFCVSHLLKLGTVAVLFYFVLLFFYLIYQLGICQCMCHTIFRVIWACFAACFSIIECGCTFLCYKLPRLKRRRNRHKRDIEDFNPSSTDEEEDDYDGKKEEQEKEKEEQEKEKEEIIGDHRRYSSRLHRKMGNKRSATRHWRNNRGDKVRKSLRPKSHRVRVGVRGDSVHLKKRNSTNFGEQGSSLAHDIRVTRTTKFAQKGSSHSIHKGLSNKRQKK